jgi:hypothetical protein
MELKTLGEVKMATKRELIADHLRVAAQIIESRGHEESAAWRMADAAVMLIDLLDSMGQTDVQGVHYASGMGGQMRKTKAFAR